MVAGPESEIEQCAGEGGRAVVPIAERHPRTALRKHHGFGLGSFRGMARERFARGLERRQGVSGHFAHAARPGAVSWVAKSMAAPLCTSVFSGLYPAQ